MWKGIGGTFTQDSTAINKVEMAEVQIVEYILLSRKLICNLTYDLCYLSATTSWKIQTAFIISLFLVNAGDISSFKRHSLRQINRIE